METNKKRVKLLIIGATGNIGSKILGKIKGNYEIRAWYRQKMIENTGLKIKWSRVDITKIDKKYISDLKWAEKIIYLAGINGMNDPRNYDLNVNCLKDILNNLDKNHSLSFIYFSTIEAHGPTGEKVVKMGQSDNPLTIYGKSKLEAEKVIKEYSLSNPLFNYYILRLGNVGLIKNYQVIINNYLLKKLFGNYEITNLKIDEIAKVVNILLQKNTLPNKKGYLTGDTINAENKQNIIWNILENGLVFLMKVTKKGGFWYYLTEGGASRSKRRYSDVIYRELNIK